MDLEHDSDQDIDSEFGFLSLGEDPLKGDLYDEPVVSHNYPSFLTMPECPMPLHETPSRNERVITEAGSHSRHLNDFPSKRSDLWDEPELASLLRRFEFLREKNENEKIRNLREKICTWIFKQMGINLQSLGIGGLKAEFAEIFQRVLIPWIIPDAMANKLGFKRVRGMLLHGPPRTGKKLLAGQIAKILNVQEPKLVTGVQVLEEHNCEFKKKERALVADAKDFQKACGDKRDLHVIIIDEVEGICKGRRLTIDNTGASNYILSQYLTDIYGVARLYNVLLIGTTCKKDLIDESLLRSGWLEVQITLGLPDAACRLEILQIHANKLKENCFLAPDVNLPELAAQTRNYTGGELEDVIRSAVSFAFARQLSTGVTDENSPEFTWKDFLCALQEVKPRFQSSTYDLQRHRPYGMVDCGDANKRIYESIMELVERVKVSKQSSPVTCLLEGPSGSGKTALAATVGIDGDFPYIKMVSVGMMLGLDEDAKLAKICKVFEDAYKSALSLIILDDIESLLGFDDLRRDYSNRISEMLLYLLKPASPKEQKLVVIGITSKLEFLDSIGIQDAFSITHHVPRLRIADAKRVLEQLNDRFSFEDVNAAAEILDDVPIRQLLLLIDLAATTAAADAGNSVERKIKVSHLSDLLPYVRR